MTDDHSEGSDDTDAAPTGGGAAASAANRSSPSNGTGTRGSRLAADVGAELRAIRIDLTESAAVGRSTAGLVAELAPRLGDVETEVSALRRQLRDLLAAQDDEDDTPGPVPTPAIGWEDLDVDQAAAAWAALARWVDRTLCSSYRLSRTELPDCWPVHPRAVRELAWLRTLHVTIAPAAIKSPGAVAEWHTRWLPAAVTNLGAAIDPRECRPGHHRLTDDERESHKRATDRAERDGHRPPALSDDTTAARPRVVLEHAPPTRDGGEKHFRGDSDRDAGPPPGPSEPRFWLPYYRDAAGEDLDHRRADAAAADAPDTPREH